MRSVYAQKNQQCRKICTEKHFVVQRAILIMCNNHVQEFVYAVFVKSRQINAHIYEYLCNTFLNFLISFLIFFKI